MKKILLVGLIVAVVAVGLWWFFRDGGLKTSSEVEATKYKNISFDVESGWSEDEQFHLVYPITENESINQETKSLIDNKRESFESRIDEQTTGIPDLNVGTEVEFATDDVVLFEIYTTDSTAEIKDEIVDTRFFDRNSGERYEIDSFFSDPSYLERLSEISRKTLPDLVNSSTEQIEDGTAAEKDNFNHFGIISETEMFIDFEPGQVAPHEQGIIKMPFKISDVEDILSDDFEKKIFPGYEAEQERQEDVKEQVGDVSNVAPQTVDAVDCQSQKCVALSFDDGPNPSTTPTLLDTLDKYNVKATFFMIGSQVAPNAALVKSIADKGHVIGNHTWDHKDLTSLSASAAKSEVDRTNDAIAAAAGVRPYLVRPPYGAINDQTRKAINHPTIEWSVDPEDWKDHNADIVFDRVVTNTTTGSVVLSHDIHATTVEAYKRIVPKLLDDGFVLVTIPQLFGFDVETVELKNYFSL